MKINKDFILREMDDMNIVVAVGDAAKDFNGVINLNSTAVFMWKKLAEGCTCEELVEAILAEYDVEKSKAEADASNFISALKKENIIDE